MEKKLFLKSEQWNKTQNICNSRTSCATITVWHSYVFCSMQFHFVKLHYLFNHTDVTVSHHIHTKAWKAFLSEMKSWFH